jgi:hypothetical protein
MLARSALGGYAYRSENERKSRVIFQHDSQCPSLLGDGADNTLEVTVTGLYSTTVYERGIVTVVKKVSTSVSVTVTVLVVASVKIVTKGTVTVEVETSYSVETTIEGIQIVEVVNSVIVEYSVKVTPTVEVSVTTMSETEEVELCSSDVEDSIGEAVTVTQSDELSDELSISCLA